VSQCLVCLCQDYLSQPPIPVKQSRNTKDQEHSFMVEAQKVILPTEVWEVRSLVLYLGEQSIPRVSTPDTIEETFRVTHDLR